MPRVVAVGAQIRARGEVAQRFSVIAGALDRAARAGLDDEQVPGVGVAAVGIGEPVAQGPLGEMALGAIGTGGMEGAPELSRLCPLWARHTLTGACD